MFKNNVFRWDVDTKKWFKCAGIRAIKTMAQTLAGFITVGAAMSEIQWKYGLSVATAAAICSLVTSVAGIPEVKESEE